MIFHCPGCGAALRYDPNTGKLICSSCNMQYNANEFQSEIEINNLVTETNDENNDSMKCYIYNCTACGAQLYINNVESSTFCPYCGQPTIVFDRVSSTLKPKYIIPFSISKEEAIHLIRAHISKGFFVPDAIRNFEIERIRGIYIPFWLYDIYYSDQQYIKGKVSRGKNTYTRYYYRDADCHFENMTLDASKQLLDLSSQRLEPYDTSHLEPFETAYLSGFYADCYDMDTEKLKPKAFQRAKELFDNQIELTIPAHSLSIIKNSPEFQIKKADYALFPAWFLTFRYLDEPYTILVNGQTGKVVGAVPYAKSTMTLLFLIIGILTSVVASFIVFLLLHMEETGFKFICLLLFINFAFFINAKNKLKKIKLSIQLSNSHITNQFVKKRQEDN